MQKNGLAFVNWVLTLLVFVPGSYDIYPGYPGHGGPSLSWPWRQALGHSCSVSTLGAVGVGMVLVQLLPSFQGPGWPPDFFSVRPPPASPPPLGLVLVTLCTTTCNCVQHTPVLDKENRVDATCSARLLPPTSSTPFPFPLPYSYSPTHDSKTELGLLQAEQFHFPSAPLCYDFSLCKQQMPRIPGSTKGFISGDLWTLILGAPAWSPSFPRVNAYTLFLCPHTHGEVVQ